MLALGDIAVQNHMVRVCQWVSLSLSLELGDSRGRVRAQVGGIISELEKIKGLYLAAIRLVQPTPALAREHYAEHASKSWFPDLEKYFISGPVVVMIWEGIDAVPLVRERIGTTDPAKSVRIVALCGIVWRGVAR